MLNVSVISATDHTLAIGNGTGGGAFVSQDGTIRGGATLDLSESIADADGTAWTIVKLPQE